MDIILGSSMKLSEIYKFHELWKDPYLCDKEGKHDYLTGLYDYLFSNHKDVPMNLLEIGVWHGGSLILWEQYFDNAKIFAIDIQDKRCDEAKKLPNTTFIIANAYDKKTAESFPDDFFDFIIEDGSHKLEDMILTIQNYYPKLKKGGYLIIEDICGLDQNTAEFYDGNVKVLEKVGRECGFKKFIMYDSLMVTVDNYCFCLIKNS